MKGSELIERSLGRSDEEMYHECLALDAVVNRKVIVIEGRGKNRRGREVYAHDAKQFYRDRIKKSIEYYKGLMENKKITLRDYQEDIANRGADILGEHGFLYLSMQVRTGKTLTSLSIASLMFIDSVLFITKKKAIPSIQADYDALSPSFEITVVNYESLHKVEGRFDMIICDEAHNMGAFPKPTGRAKLVKETLEKSGNPLVIFLSGTPTPESYSQMYHQVYGIPNNPFSQWNSFYKFARPVNKNGSGLIDVKQKKIGGMTINDYSDGSEKIIEAMAPYTISYSQSEAGFLVDTREHFITVSVSDTVKRIAAKLKRDLVVEGKGEIILADTPVKLMQKLHQIYSGTVKFESGNSMVLDTTKAEFIKKRFEGKKIGVFYKFVEELNAIKQVFGDGICTDLETFESTDKSIALQIVSGREGISLKLASALVYYNIDFSATSYWQSRDRMTTKDRLVSDVYWIFSDSGIEKDIYTTVSAKKTYTLKHFNRDVRGR
jgi:hypothetical protein